MTGRTASSRAGGAPVEPMADGRSSLMNISRRTLLSSTMLAAAAPAFAQSRPVYRDRHASVDDRVADLLGRMTIEEKVAQLRGMWGRKTEIYDAEGNFAPARASVAMPHGIGHIGRPSDYRGMPLFDTVQFRTIENSAAFINALQRFLLTKTRLGIPALCHEEAAHGLLAADATIFPIPLGLASTWDPALIEQVFTVAARQTRTRGAHLALTPVIDLLRDPRYGRSEEFFGEDPHLVGQMGLAAVRGLQGRQRPLGPDRVFVTLKHLLHGVPQGGLNISPSDMSERSIRESFLVPFETIIKAADPAVIMPSYNEVGGVPSHENKALLQDTVRGRLGFKGAFISDYDAISNLMAHHHVAADLPAAAELAIDAGIAGDLPEGASYAFLPELVQAGRVPMATVDTMVGQILRLKFEAGLFENPYVDARRARRTTNLAGDRTLARVAAEKSIVLLKNDGVLPLATGAAQGSNGRLKLAVIGPNATEPLFGGYSGDNPDAIGILAGLRAGAPNGVDIAHADGVWITPPDTRGRHRSYSPIVPVDPADNARRMREAVTLAEGSDVVVLVLGDVPAVTREAVAIEYPGDRSTLGLWGQQDELFEKMVATGKPIVCLLLNGRPLAIPRLAEKANALLEGWYLGQEGGTAFARILFGQVNPGGKLPVSFPRSVGELPVYYDRHPSADTNIYLEGRRTPVFPFGHGLSYTSFDIAAPRLPQPEIRAGEPFSVIVAVSNTGSRRGDEVVQLYIRDDVSSVPRPILELKDFRRITLEPGERREVRFDLPGEALAFWNRDMQKVVEPGTFQIMAGNSSANLKTTVLQVVG